MPNIESTARRDLADRQARLIIDNAVDYGIVGLDLAGDITSWNPGAERIMGWKAEEAIGQSARMFFTPEDVANRVPETEMSDAASRGRGIDERWHLRQDGSRFWASGELMPLCNEADELEGYVKILRDRTIQRQAAEALTESESRYRRLYDSIDEGFCLIEVRCNDSAQPVDYRFVEVNSAFERQTGIVDAPGNWMRDLAPGHEEHWFDVYARVALTGEVARFTLPAHALNGRWYEVFAYRVGDPDERMVAVLFSDITERRMNEARLQSSEESLRIANIALQDSQSRLEALVSASSEVGYTMSPDWSVMVRLSGGGVLADTPKPDADWMARYIHPDDREIIRARIDDAVRTNSPFQFEHRVFRVDGSIGYVSTRAVPILDGLGNITEWFGAATDITEQHHASEELARADRLRFGLADLSEQLRSVEDVDAMQSAAAEVIGTALHVARVGYGSVTSDGETFTVPTDWTAPGFPRSPASTRWTSMASTPKSYAPARSSSSTTWRVIHAPLRMPSRCRACRSDRSSIIPSSSRDAP